MRYIPLTALMISTAAFAGEASTVAAPSTPTVAEITEQANMTISAIQAQRNDALDRLAAAQVQLAKAQKELATVKAAPSKPADDPRAQTQAQTRVEPGGKKDEAK
jgi:hypothetical protein